MIEVIFIKNDPYMNKVGEKTTLVATPEKARAKAEAIASINKLSKERIKEELGTNGELVRIIIDSGLGAAPVAAQPTEERYEDLKARIERLEVAFSELLGALEKG